jgi:twitching motility protein PilT
MRGRIAAVEILQSTPRTREYIENGEAEGNRCSTRCVTEARRHADFDTVIRDFIERNIVTREDGVAFATNQNNLRCR